MGDDFEPVPRRCRFTGHGASGAITPLGHIAGSTSRVGMWHRDQPFVSREEQPALGQGHGMTAHLPQSGQRCTVWRHQAQVDRHAHFAARLQTVAGLVHRIMSRSYQPRDRVFHRNDRKVDGLLADTLYRLDERVAGDGVGAIRPMLPNGHLAERTCFALKGHAGPRRMHGLCHDRIRHVRMILTSFRGRDRLLGMTRHASAITYACRFYYPPTRMGPGEFGMRS